MRSALGMRRYYEVDLQLGKKMVMCNDTGFGEEIEELRACSVHMERKRIMVVWGKNVPRKHEPHPDIHSWHHNF